MAFRKLLFWVHLAAGVTAGIVILVMSATGVLLTYERQLIEWSDSHYRSVAPQAGAPRLSVESLLAKAGEQRPGQTPTGITLRAEDDAPAAVTLGNATVYQDVYTGQLLGEQTQRVRRAMSELRSWHRYMALDGENRAFGKAVSGWSNLLFLFIVLSGMYLWIPRVVTWSSVRAVALFRGGLPGKARDFNWHNVIGIWSAVPLAIVVATAAPISFPWANALVYRIVGEEPPAPAGGGAGRGGPQAGGRGGENAGRGGPNASGGSGQNGGERAGNGGARAERQQQPLRTEGIDALWARAEQQVPGWWSINLRLPAPSAPAVFAIDSGNGGQPQLRETLTLDAATAEVVRWEPFESQSTGRRLRSWSRFTHTGEYYGLIGQTIAGLVSGGGVVLVYTGLALAFRRFTAWLRKDRAADRYRSQESEAA
jgi:uncharacterized iron-regulated membrane protein